MKRFLLILIVVLITVTQNTIIGQQVFYYYQSAKIEIPVKKDCFNIYFDKAFCPIDTIQAHFSVIGQIYEADSLNYVCIVWHQNGALQKAIEDKEPDNLNLLPKQRVYEMG